MAATNVVIRGDGAYLVLDDGREIPLGGVQRLGSQGHLTVRYPARDVTIIEPIDRTRAFDHADILLMRIAALLGGITVAQIAAIRPGVATLVQNWLTTNGLVAGSVD